MKRIKRLTEAEESKIDITPMLDVVFIMLIFFIVTANFVKESGVDVDKPLTDTAEIKEKATILLAITDRDEVWLDRRKIDPRAIKANIARLKADNPEGEVIVQADAQASATILLQVVKKLKEAGIQLPTVATIRQGG